MTALALLGHSVIFAQDEEPPTPPPAPPVYHNEVLLVVGAEGEAEYGQIFEENHQLWKSAASEGQVNLTVIDAADKDSLKAIETHLAEASKDVSMPLWIVFIGHGTYDRREAYFNLAGPDLSAVTLKEWLEPYKRPLIVINTASSSGAFLPILSESNRIIVTATKSGTEVNYASFGSYLANALLEPEADLNNDGENSIFELYQYAARQTAEFYEQEGRIATETPLIDDNGDGRGTSLEALAGLLEGGKSSSEPDGSFANRWALVLSEEEKAIPADVRQKRNVLEAQIGNLRRDRVDLEEEAYYSELEALAVEIAELYAGLEPPVTEESLPLAKEDPSSEVEVEAVPNETGFRLDIGPSEESAPVSQPDDAPPVAEEVPAPELEEEAVIETPGQIRPGPIPEADIE
jgi:hypothetical protein